MPITQERFLTVLSGAKAILDKERSIQNVIEDAEQIMSDANSALDTLTDQKAKNALAPLLGLVNTITTIARTGGMVYTDLMITVLAELKHFDKAKVMNARAARLQRKAREEKGIRPRQDYLLGEQLAPSMTPTLQPLYLEGISNHEVDAQREPPKDLSETQGFINFTKKMNKLHAADAFNPNKGENK